MTERHRLAGIAFLAADAGYRTANFVKLTTDTGLVGWSQYYSMGQVPLEPIIERYAQIVMENGIDPTAPGQVSSLLHVTGRSSAGGVHYNAIGALENACLDLQGKAAGLSVGALFGGPFRSELPLYWTHCGSFRVRNAQLYERELGVAPIRTVDDLVAVGAEARAAGFTAVKTNPISFSSGTPAMFSGGFRVAPGVLERDPGLRRTISDLHAQLDAMREGLGPDVDLSLDTAFAYRTEEYLKLARALERHGLRWLELDSLDAGVIAQVRRGADVPIASGESMYGLHGYRPLFEQQAVDVLLIDVMWNGCWAAQRVATLADAFEVNIAPHCPVGELGLLMSAQFAASIPNFDILEFRYDEMPWIWDFLTNPPTIENGVLTVPDGPGWGSDIDEEAVAAHPPRDIPAPEGRRA